MDVTLSIGGALAVTVGLPSAGIGDPPSATLTVMGAFGGETYVVGGLNSYGGSIYNSDAWHGPAVFGP